MPKDESLDRSTVRAAITEAATALRHDNGDARLRACDALGLGTAEWSACRSDLIEELDEATEWMDREQALVDAAVPGAPLDSDIEAEFIPGNRTIALVQSALDEELERPEGLFWPRDPRWLSSLYQRLRGRARGKASFPIHRRDDDFRHPLADDASVALVSDWGMGNVHARAVAKQIQRRSPEHVIHLGDVYYSGTPREAQRNVLDVWRDFGPPQARYWGLNGNHDMYSGGHGFFQHLLPAFGQKASYFLLENAHWRIVALDTAYVNHSIAPEQLPWLRAQLTGSQKTILLTHHHLLSPFRKRGDALEEALEPWLADGRLYAWIWGHEHHLFEFADHRGVKCRCIGHGAVPYIPPDQKRRRQSVEIVRMETRMSPLDPRRGMHGFMLLRFEGKALHVEHVDEVGGVAWTERWE